MLILNTVHFFRSLQIKSSSIFWSYFSVHRS
jgi:hypothetical protein